MDTIHHWIDLILHADTSLQMLVNNYQGWTYLILAVIIFCETGLVITPFLPGDSLLFAAGVIASGLGVLNIYNLLLVVFLAAFAGDNSNYFIGNFIGQRILNFKWKLVRKEHLDRTHAFYEKHGGKTIIMARFVPIIRTFAPFVAGLGSMGYKRFISFSILGNLLWINSFLWAGYLLGNNEFVKKHFTQVTFGIIFISLIPAIYGAIRSRTANS
jgi:membrane-associated protein